MKKIILVSIFIYNSICSQDISRLVEHHYAVNDSVKIHYVTMGSGPLIVMLHGFPDFWYTWRKQMKVLAESYKLAAVDLRGYNKSGKPEGVDNYSMRYLIRDVLAVIKSSGYKKAILVGHDWGGAIAWQVAMNVPQVINGLIILGTPHPRGLFREINTNTKQKHNSSYARDFQKDGAHENLTPESLSNWVADATAKPFYLEAFRNSDIEAMLNYYKASFPKQKKDSGSTDKRKSNRNSIKFVKCPTLAIFGMNDSTLLPAGWSGTWDWIDNTLTLISVPDAGHFVQHDAPNLVTKSIQSWLKVQSGSQN